MDDDQGQTGHRTPWALLLAGAALAALAALVIWPSLGTKQGPVEAPSEPAAGVAQVDLGNLPLPAPPERVAPSVFEGTRAVSPLAHVYVGQTFEFVSQMSQPTMTISTTEVWTVRSIDPEREVRYDTKTTTQVQMKNPPRGMPRMRPNTIVSRGQRYPVPSASKRNKRTRKLKPVGEELLDVSEFEFECKVYLVKGTKSWISEQFPGAIKMQSRTMTRKLVKVSSPQ